MYIFQGKVSCLKAQMDLVSATVTVLDPQTARWQIHSLRVNLIKQDDIIIGNPHIREMFWWKKIWNESPDEKWRHHCLPFDQKSSCQSKALHNFWNFLNFPISHKRACSKTYTVQIGLNGRTDQQFNFDGCHLIVNLQGRVE